jgi:hypothetical protein
MKELFPYNNIKVAYRFITKFLQDNYNIEKIKGKTNKDTLNISFKYNSLESEISIIFFNSKGFNNLHLTFDPFMDFWDDTSYELSGWEINITNLKRLLKLCKYYDIPRCKKCGKYPIKYFEEGFKKTSYSADLTGNPYLYKYQQGDYPLFPVKVIAECSCGNRWILRGIISASQIKEKSTLKNGSQHYIERNPMRMRTQKEIDELLTQPYEYAKIENTKNHFRRKNVITKKEIKDIIKAINAGEENAK